MKHFKIVDIALQLAVTLFFAASGIIQNNFGDFFYWYFVLGGLQLLSFFIHLLRNEGYMNWQDRKRYGQTLLWIIIIGLITLLMTLVEIPLILFYLIALLFVGPVMAIWYFTISVSELNTIRKKELIHLK